MSIRIPHPRIAGYCVSVLIVLTVIGPASAQSSRLQQRLASLQQQNALQQQQNAVQTALQQTTTLLQSAAYQQNGVPQLNFQPQQTALQMAIQQTNNLLQASFRRNSSLSQLALQQLNTLQTVNQQSIYLQSSILLPNGQLSTYQMQVLTQEQNSLTGLLTSQAPPAPRGMYRK